MAKSVKFFIEHYYKRYKNFILYGFIGGLSAGLDFVVFALLSDKLGINHQIANLISIHCGIICSFFLNRQYNFKVKDKFLLRFFSFYIIGLAGLLLSAVILHVMINIKGWNEIYTKLISIIAVAVLQFLLNKFITFKKTEN